MATLLEGGVRAELAVVEELDIGLLDGLTQTLPLGSALRPSLHRLVGWARVLIVALV